MDLWGSHDLIEVPDLSKAPNLETLDLTDCYSLVKLPSSIPHPNKLTTINVKNCRNLETIPIGISLKSVEVLNLYGCSLLRTIPLFSTNISHLSIDETSIEEMPSVLHLENFRLENLSYLSMKNVKSEKLWERVQPLTLLTTMLSPSLNQLYLSEIPSLVGLPTSFQNLHQLMHLEIKNCVNLETLPTRINLEAVSGSLDSRPRYLSSVTELTKDRHKNADVRTAACICFRNAARSVKNLSAGRFTNDHVMLPLVQLLHDPSSSVEVAVLGALSNIVLDFSSPKSTFIEYGGIKQLIELSKSMDPNDGVALRALRNLMFLADNKRKSSFIQRSRLKDLFPLSVILSPRFKSKLWPSCVILLMDVSTPLSLECMLTNVASGTELHKEAVMQQLFPQPQAESNNFMLKFLQSHESQLRSATVWTIINLISPSSPGAHDRHVKLRMRIRIRTVLSQSMSFGDN
ncbi:hypothetical protein Bca52824_080772 [Brassica carinata]|uniref:Uncharacterized protein n=1 Tax=Brassica carinata TaxID=52824 RepID=A0A8X7TRA1_BRACI|nr:hypothetical protein Bca52824_080772 [Brassica carinata]